MVTMATTSVTPTKPRLDQPNVKFMAVKVDVSQLTNQSKSKAFVISSKTTSRDLADMVMRKLKVDDVKRRTCLLAEKPGGGKILLEPDARVLRYYGNHPRKAPVFELVPADSVDPIMLLTSLNSTSRDDGDVIKSGNLGGSARNGLTLPGYDKSTRDANSNVCLGDGFLTSTPNPDCESVASTADSGFMIQYEPYNGADETRPAPTRRTSRSKSFELATENGRSGGVCGNGVGGNGVGVGVGDVSDNASDSGLIVSGHGQSSAAGADGWRCADGPLRNYPYRPSPRDGFQILQSENSAWRPFDRHVSDGLLKALGQRAQRPRPLGNSVPDVRSPPAVGERSRKAAPPLRRRRSLPRMSVSQEELDEKKRSVADLFAVKLKLFLDRSRRPVPESETKRHGRGALPADVPSGGAGTAYAAAAAAAAVDDDDVVSVTSQEVAQILSAASPMKPYEEEEGDEETGSEERTSAAAAAANNNNNNHEDENDISPNLARDKQLTPQNVFQPLSDASPLSCDDDDDDQSPTAASVTTTTASDESRFQCSEGTPERTDPDRRTLKTNCCTSDPPIPHWLPQERHRSSARGIPLFTLLVTHLLAPVTLQRALTSSAHLWAVRLCDVTYVKCVRHVLRHWEATSRQFSVDAKLAQNMLVAVGGVDRRSVAMVAGKLFRGDIIVEVNGKSALQMSAREVIGQMNKSEVVSLVVARSRLNVERAQSP